WSGARAPDGETLTGRYCRLEKLEAGKHARQLFDAYAEDASGALWTYLSDEAPDSFQAFEQRIVAMSALEDPLYYAIVDRGSGRALGRAAYLRVAPGAGSIEVGSIAYGPRLQRTPAATEAMFLMLQHAFEGLGYRRYEWKCDSLNEPSRRAAERLGFSYEGLFRQALVYKGRNRDTAWYSIIDQDWPQIRSAFEQWFDPANFDSAGRQKQSLGVFMSRARNLEA
ncbi:MAG: GNAT family protein, partial [Pseudomonadota bacterium]